MESASESERSSVSDVEDISATHSPELSDISKLLLKAKAAAEVGGCGFVGVILKGRAYIGKYVVCVDRSIGSVTHL